MSQLASFKGFLFESQNKIIKSIINILFLKDDGIESVFLGTDYGGYFIPKSALKIKNGLLISAGLGNDVSFEKALYDKGYHVIGIDPLIESIEYSKKELPDKNLARFVQAGLWFKTGNERFFAPKKATHDSWSIVNLPETNPNEFKVFDVISLEELAKNNNDFFSKDILIIKMNIEGAEKEILETLASSNQIYDAIIFQMEFLYHISFLDFKKRFKEIVVAMALLKKLNKKGYILKLQHHNQYLLIHTKSQLLQ